MNTDVDIIVCNLYEGLFSVSALEQYDCVQKSQAATKRQYLPKGCLDSQTPLHIIAIGGRICGQG